LLPAVARTADGTVPATFGSTSGIAGVVVDPLGRGLERVEVFLVPDSGVARLDAPPVGPMRVETDGLGRFVAHGLVPGIYRVAAVKSGYGVFFDRVNTQLRSTLDVVLHPIPGPGEPGADNVADDAAWSLRLPGRSVWHDLVPGAVDGAVEVRSGPAATDGSSSLLGEFLAGRVDQTIAIAAPSAAAWSGGVQGSATRMQLSSAITERARLEFTGARASLDGGRIEDSSALPASYESTALDVGFRYQTSAEDRVDVRAFWASRDFAVGLPGGGAVVPAQAADSVWGYDAGWTRQLDADSTLAIRMDYAASTLALPSAGASTSDAWSGGHDALASGANRAVGAGGTYHVLPGDGHEVRVVFGARFTDLALPDLRPVPAGRPVLRLDEAGWDLRIEAEDVWSIHGPFALIYGLGYRHRIADAETALLIPAVGGAYASGPVSVRAVVRYHAEAVLARGDLTVNLDPLEERTSRNAIGYEAIAETRLPLGFEVRGGVSYAPIRTDPVGYEGGAYADLSRPLYVSNGDASTHEVAGTLSRVTGPVRTYVEVRRGEVVGDLAAVLPFDLPFHALDEATLRFRAGRIGLMVPTAGTHVQIEHRRLRDRAVDLAPAVRGQDHVELRVVQDLLHLPGASWRLLFAFRAAELDDGAVEYASRIHGDRLPDSHRQVNAGISVAF
jgi:hypothetical protein